MPELGPAPSAPRVGPHRSGFVALLGWPNAGKSTLLNRLLGQKVAIVGPKPQTTRGPILGILTTEAHQIAFVDTPGVHEGGRGLGTALNDAATLAAQGGEVMALVVDAAARRDDEADAELLKRFPTEGHKLALLLNKADLVQRPLLLPLIQRWTARRAFDLVYPLSALTGDNVEGLPAALADLLPEGPRLFPDDQVTDQTERALVGELVREQIYRLTHEEVPYSVAVEVQEFDESARRPPRPRVRIDAVIFTARESQKGILIGKGGQKLKAIGIAARREIERLLGCGVHLALTVRVETDWTESPASLRRFLGRT